jgi:hypothetical protein
MKDVQIMDGDDASQFGGISVVKHLSVDDVVSLFAKCKFGSAADVIAENQIDGKTLYTLSDEDLFAKVEDGGLGLKPLQLKRIR